MFAICESVTRDAHEGDDSARLLVCNIAETSTVQQTQRNSFVDVCEFHFPPMKFGAHILGIEIRSDPSPSSFTQGNVYRGPRSQSTGSNARSAVPFSVSQENRTYAVTICALADTDEDEDEDEDATADPFVTLRFFIPLSTFMSRINTADSPNPHVISVIESDESERSPPEMLPARDIACSWANWGPDGSRAFAMPSTNFEDNYVCYIYGSRYVSEHTPRSTASRRRLRLLDFNQRSLRRSLSVADATSTNPAGYGTRFAPGITVKKTQTRIVTEPSTLWVELTGVFEEDLTTRLPYQETILSVSFEVFAAMITEDCLILQVSSQTFRDQSIIFLVG
jgi:hypothetical protein